MKLRQRIEAFVFPKIKFASTSAVATVVDYSLFLILVYAGLPKVKSNIISASVGFLVNFFLQKRFIFVLKRKVRTAFLMSLSFSMLGVAISTALIWLLSLHEFLDQRPYVTKLLVTGIMFFYNFYTKRLAFEKKLMW